MYAWLSKLWDSLTTSLWLVPTLMTIAALLLAVLMEGLDGALKDKLGEPISWLYRGSPQGAQTLISTIAGSMITVAGVTFSITIVALTLASSQFGPRVLRNFMRDRGNQIVLGTFVATFVYCVMVLSAIRGSTETDLVPQVSVSMAVLLAVLSLGVLIFFFHHVSTSIHADSVVGAIVSECRGAINSLFPEEIGEGLEEDVGGDGDTEIDEASIDAFARNGRSICSGRSGYIQLIDGGRLVSLASKHNMKIRMYRRPGNYVVEGTTLMIVSASEELTDDLAQEVEHSVIIGQRRTPLQDVEFPINQLVEVAARALSPGVNDPFTAMTCVDSLGAILSQMGRRKIPSPYRFDDNGELRVIADTTTFEGAVDSAFNQIRQSARGNVAVTIRLLDTLTLIAEQARRASDRTALTRQAEMLRSPSAADVPEESDRQAIEERYEEFRRAADR